MKSLLWITIIAVCVGASVVYSQDAAVDLSGKWAFQVETGAGTGNPSIELKQQGEKLTGHYSGQLGEAELTGTVKGKAITFTFTAEIQGNSLQTTYTGTIESKDSLKGTLNIAGLGDGTFTAKRN